MRLREPSPYKNHIYIIDLIADFQRAEGRVLLEVSNCSVPLAVPIIRSEV
jgi:hypothetical protein